MKELLVYLFGLPGIFMLLFIVLTFYLFVSKYSKARTVSIIILVGSFLFTSEFVGKFAASFLVEGVKFKKADVSQIDMIVVPTQGVEYNGELLGWLPNEASFKAGQIAYELQNKMSDRKVPVLLCGGNMEGNGGAVESEIIKNFFNRQTTQIRKTLIDDVSQNTYEQVWQCASIMKRYNTKTPVLVINELEMLRVLSLFRSRGIEMIPFPIFVMKDAQTTLQDILPSFEGLLLNKAVLTEYINIALDLINQKVSFDDVFYKEENSQQI